LIALLNHVNKIIQQYDNFLPASINFRSHWMMFFDSPDSLPQKQSDYLKKNNIHSYIFIPIQDKGEL